MVKPIFKHFKTKPPVFIKMVLEDSDWKCFLCHRDICGGAFGKYPYWLCSECEYEMRNQLKKQNQEAIEFFKKREDEINNAFKEQVKDLKKRFLWKDGQKYSRLSIARMLGYKCQYCNNHWTTPFLVVHHESYNPEKVTLICKKCHFKAHFNAEERKKKYEALRFRQYLKFASN